MRINITSATRVRKLLHAIGFSCLLIFCHFFIYIEQGCGSALFFEGLDSAVVFNADPDPAAFSIRIRIQRKKIVKITLRRACRS